LSAHYVTSQRLLIVPLFDDVFSNFNDTATEGDSIEMGVVENHVSRRLPEAIQESHAKSVKMSSLWAGVRPP
jgi:hypothetical protein